MPKDIVTIETTLPTNFSSENVCNDVHIDVIQIALNKFASNNEIPAIIGLLIEKKIKINPENKIIQSDINFPEIILFPNFNKIIEPIIAPKKFTLCNRV